MESDNTNDLYKECLRNHAASLGSYATDGCGEFTLDDTSSPYSLQCAACGCHRNFHRKVTYSNSSNRRDHIMHPPSSETVVMDMIDYAEGNNERDFRPPVMVVESGDRSGKKRHRTKFTPEQKEKMLGFAEKLGWKLQRKDEEDEVERFCRGIGISRQVFKVWMHNHKNSSSSTSASTGNASSLTTQEEGG
ncbi:PREDICTED: zinc-finger homeodomain protein 4-like [Populus euphratica]|uniref:Zinc-finger homeodomain protein 4-like n=1 Tax=Populus euphratica TaxID=75702 RepID=A0AAJ6XYC8_POPEU|nr:PREDICTED: zinc-finger homeodomain protein 4-like [Populus euphratica]